MKETMKLTNEHVLSQRAITVSYAAFTFVDIKASNNASCFSTSYGLASASASIVAILATTAGEGVGAGFRG